MRHVAGIFGVVAGALLAAAACARTAPVPERPAPEPESPAPEETPMNTDDLEFRPAEGFPGVELGYSFVHDRGHELMGARLGGKFHDTRRMAPLVLAAAGWATADAAGRGAIAERYAREVLGWRRVASEAADLARGEAKFEPFGSRADGGRVVVRAWVDDTVVGMRPPMVREWRLHEAAFSADGQVTDRVVASHDAPWER